MTAAASRTWQWLKERPWVAPLVLIGGALLVMWALYREAPFELSDVPPEVLAAIPEKLCESGPKFKTLTTRLKRVVKTKDGSAEADVQRVESHVEGSIALRREKWFETNTVSPISEMRSFSVCGFISLHYDERQPLPIFGNIAKELGWSKDRITALTFHTQTAFPTKLGGEIAFTKATNNDLNPDTRLKEAAVRPTRCEVADRIKANKVHAKLTGDAYQVNCSSDTAITTTGGIPAKEKSEKIKRTTTYYFIEQLGWFVPAREVIDEDRWTTTLVDFAVK